MLTGARSASAHTSAATRGHTGADAGAEMGGFECDVLERVPDQRIVFRWGFVGPDRGRTPSYDSLLTVTLPEAPDGGTVLTLVHERLGALAAVMPQVAENVAPGWDSALGKLAAAARA